MMKNVNPGSNFTKDTKDYTLLSFADELNTVIFGPEVLITQIWKTQFRVYSAAEKAKIDKCEDEHSAIPHSKLRKMYYGHPKENGESPFCTSAHEHLKVHVGNRTLSREDGAQLDESSIDKVNARISNLCAEGRVSSRELGWADRWDNKKLIAGLPPNVELAQSVRKAKLYESPDELKTWFAVSMLH